jgi:hypothetical protein
MKKSCDARDIRPQTPAKPFTDARESQKVNAICASTPFPANWLL